MTSRALVALVAVATAAYAGYRTLGDRQDGSPRFTTQKADKGPIVARITAAGTLSALVTVQVGSQVSGRILELAADFNSPVHKGIAKQAKEIRGAIQTLAHYIDVNWLREAYRRTRKDGARGVDGQSAESYAEQLEGNLQSLLDRAKTGRYRVPPVRRNRCADPTWWFSDRAATMCVCADATRVSNDVS